MSFRHCLLLAACLSLNAAAEIVHLPAPPMPGSYQPAEITAEIREVARFAVREQGQQAGETLKLLKVLGCERQVVAGMNYRLRLDVRRDGKPASASALVFAALDGSRTLVTWTWDKPAG